MTEPYDEEDLPGDECQNDDPENCLIHGPEPDVKDILFVEGFEVSHGYVHLGYGGGLSEGTEELFEDEDGMVPVTFIRLHVIDPQTGTKVNLTYGMAPFMGHGMGIRLAEASFNKTVSLQHVWEPTQADPEKPGDLQVAASWEGWREFMENHAEEHEEDDQ